MPENTLRRQGTPSSNPSNRMKSGVGAIFTISVFVPYPKSRACQGLHGSLESQGYDVLASVGVSVGVGVGVGVVDAMVPVGVAVAPPTLIKI